MYPVYPYPIHRDPLHREPRHRDPLHRDPLHRDHFTDTPSEGTWELAARQEVTSYKDPRPLWTEWLTDVSENITFPLRSEYPGISRVWIESPEKSSEQEPVYFRLWDIPFKEETDFLMEVFNIRARWRTVIYGGDEAGDSLGTSSSHSSGRCVSYWNAFLLNLTA